MEKIESQHIQHHSYSAGLAQKIVLRVLQGMQYGQLTLYLPQGQSLCFGQGGGVKAEIRVRQNEFFRKVMLFGDVGLGEAYMAGDWETSSIETVLNWLILNTRPSGQSRGLSLKRLPIHLLRGLTRLRYFLEPNNIRGSEKNIHAHYDLSNDFFRLMLDDSMTYSSAIFNTPKDDLYTAQQNKYRSLAEALEIKSDDSVLEVGSGWGGMAIFLATNYGCHVRTITISRQQFAYVKQQIENLKLTDHITVEYMDYRHLTGKYDKIVSIEMVEAVGHRYMPDYFTALSRCLKQDGLLGIQAITAPDARYDDYRRGLSWLQKHIFPGSLLPSLNYILHTANRMGGLQLHKHRDIGQHYIKTLELWRDRFEQNIEQLSNMGFDETFCRKWRYYLAYCIAAFASRNASDVQIVLTRPNNLNLDDSVLQQGA